MDIRTLISKSIKPPLYEKGSAVMWTDPYISGQLLEVHLNPDVDLASRKPGTILKTVDWILSHLADKKLNILDLGCGPGLYAEAFARKAHEVTGLDFSEYSINYAKKEADRKNLDISYICGNYLEINLPEEQFDLVLLIFTDFGPLLPVERTSLLNLVKKVLKPGGIFIFDVMNDRDIEKNLSPRSWEAQDKGFWRDRPHLVLSESFLYPEEKVILYQHTIIEDQDKIETYRFWNHFFSKEDLKNILHDSGFCEISFYENVIPSSDMYDAEKIIFCKGYNVK